MMVLQSLSHAHIVHIHGWTEWPGSMALVLEYLPAGNLYTLLRDQQNKVHTCLRLRMCFEVADAIAFIHNRAESSRLVHGDIKPENVLLTEDLHCKLSDFGSVKLATCTGVTTVSVKAEQEDDVLTTVYAAPERLGDAPVRPRKEQDTYSFGLVVHMALTGEVPYEIYPSISAYLQAVKNGARPDTELVDELKRSVQNSLEVEIVEALESVMKCCWDQTPSKRPKMIDVQKALKELLARTKSEEIIQNVLDERTRQVESEPTTSSNIEYATLLSFDSQERSFRLGINKCACLHVALGNT